MACVWNISAQTKTYHGTVMDAANNEPLIGATIAPIGGGQGTAADVEGKFTITVPANAISAQVSARISSGIRTEKDKNMTEIKVPAMQAA